MKKITLLSLIVLFSLNLNGQIQDAFNFQAVIRNNEGEPLKNQKVKIMFEILDDINSGTVVYRQESDVTTNKYGLVTAEIGNSPSSEDDFNKISWSGNPLYIRILADLGNSGQYEEVGITRLLSVPYAMYAKTAGNTYWQQSEDGIYYNVNNVGIGSSNPNNVLSVSLPTTGSEQGRGISLTRNEGHIELINGTKYDGHFQARISGQSTHEDSPGLVIVGTPSHDEASKHGIVLRSGEEKALQNANALTVQNFEQSLITVKADGKTGFGKENPEYQVDVAGTINASSLLINGEEISSTSPWNTSNSNIYFNTGKVGIGTDTPENLLNVAIDPTGDRQGQGISLSRNQGHLDLKNGTKYDGHFQARISGNSTHEDSPGLVIVGTPSQDEASKHGILLRSGEEKALQNANALTVQNFEQSLITVKADGKTGFGKENPEYQVDVAGTINASSVLINGEEINSTSPWNTSNSNTYFNTGQVGIGTDTPENLLDVAIDPTGDRQGQGISLSRNQGHLDLENGTKYDGHFQARISGKSTHEDSPGLVIVGTPSQDEASKHGILLRSGEEKALQNANALTVQNFEESLLTVKADGKTGIGTTSPKSKLQVADGDIYIEDAASGVIMTSPNGSCWRMTVDDNGNPQFTSITCPE